MAHPKYPAAELERMVQDRPQLPKGHLKPPKPPKPNILRACWMRGILSYKLFPHQKILYHSLKAAMVKEDCLKYVVNCSRRFGKSTIASIICIEYCLSHPDAHVWLTAPTVKSLLTLSLPIVKQILEDCPDDLAPKYRGQYNKFHFHNGSVLHLVGTDKKHYEALRGQRSDLNIIDEAGFCSDLDYMLQAIMIPQTLTTGGKTILVSTPPKSPSHDFFDIAKSCELAGNYSCFTIDDNTSIDDETKELYIKEAGGRESTTFRREYMCEFVTDSESAIIPEWEGQWKYTKIPRAGEDPLWNYWHKYDSMDLGVKDMTAMLFAVYNFQEAILYIEAEDHIQGPSMTTAKIHEKILHNETVLWPKQRVYRRISDNNNLLLLQDLQAMHGTSFIATGKDSLEAMVNEMRLFIQAGRLRVHHSCKLLLGCLEYGIWHDYKDRLGARHFGRSKTYGHFDHLAALMYLIRNLDVHTNPIPNLLGVSRGDSYVRKGWKDQPYDGSTASAMRRIMGLEDGK